jgi:hypothetical protein
MAYTFIGIQVYEYRQVEIDLSRPKYNLTDLSGYEMPIGV